MARSFLSINCRYRRDRFGVLAAFTLALVASGPAHAEDLIDPCEGYRDYVAIGGAQSGPAEALKRVCDAIGAVTLTQPCLVYYSRLTDPVFPPEAELAASLAAQCEATTPGGSGLITGTGAGNAPGGPCRDRPCVGEDSGLVPAADADPAAAAGMLECGAGQECRPEPEDPPPDKPVSAADPSAQQTAASADPALDLAFWQAIADSNDSSLYAAYLERFPSGTFAPIAAARIKALGAGTPATTPAPPPVAATPAAASASPEELFAEAETIMDAAYRNTDPSRWDAAALQAIPLYQSAGDGGWAPAYFALGALAETGIGGAEDPDRALAYFTRAGGMGDLDGYFRALMVLDTVGNGSGFVETFLTLYRLDAARALGSLEAVGRTGPLALQAYLADQGYYSGALDGAFGAGSRAALAAFAAGAPPAGNVPAPAPAGGDRLAADLQQGLARVGCYHGVVDGSWGPASANAMANFNLWNSSSIATDHASEAALVAVSATPGPICGVD